MSVPELSTSEASAAAAADPIRVVVVDDSAVIRGLITRCIEGDRELTVVGSAANGAIALRQIERLRPDIVVLDIEMPEMDGLTALPKLLQIDPDVKVIMASTLTLRNADISLKALAAGASDYIPKPSSARELQGAAQFQRDLVDKIKALGAARRARINRDDGRQSPPAKAGAAFKSQRPANHNRRAPIVLRAASRNLPRVLAIGSSTGGPQALFKLFSHLKGRIDLPVIVTQHMPATFTTILAEHLHRIIELPCAEARDSEAVQPGHVYIAPGDWHLTVENDGRRNLISLNQDAPENFCRPAVDPMLRSLSRAYGPGVLAVILTGMGHDGFNGGQSVVGAGGTIVAQDEASSVVWGMPGAVATGGLCSAVVPIDEIGATVERFVRGSGA